MQSIDSTNFVYYHSFMTDINMAKQIDLCTNLICVSLSYQFFDEYYRKCCCMCDVCCQQCCKPMNNGSEDTELSTVQSKSTQYQFHVTTPEISNNATTITTDKTSTA